jgi:predicted AAA+ superfamily ATPase
VERDVRQFSQITDLVAFRTLVSLAALRTAQVMNISQLGRDAQLTAATTTRFLQLLETSFLVRRLPSFRKNRGSRLLKAPKLLFTDSGLAAYLSQFRTPDTALWGALLETWVAQNVSSILEAHLPQAELSYWHEQGRHEVDLVIESAGRVYALEIKLATRWSDSDLSGLRAFLDRTPQCEAAILAYNGRSVASLSPKLWAIPLGHLLA